MPCVIPGKIANATTGLPPSFVRLAHQAKLLTHRGGRIADLFDGALQLIPADAKMPRPVVHLVRLAHRNMAAVALALVEKVVGHLSEVLERKTPPEKKGEALFCRAAAAAWRKEFVSLAG
jgi:hypothetical protein